jgi:hypothetical protein
MKDLLRIADLNPADLGLLLDEAASAAALAGMDFAVATSYGLEPHPEVVARARALAAQHGSRVQLTLDPAVAVRDADAVVTDSWLSMHDPDGAGVARAQVLAPFRVDRRLLADKLQGHTDAVPVPDDPAPLAAALTAAIRSGAGRPGDGSQFLRGPEAWNLTAGTHGPDGSVRVVHPSLGRRWLAP